MSVRRKIDVMHDMFGTLPDKLCENCANLLQADYRGKHYRKCLVYGATHSEATDWRKHYIACGLFNKEWPMDRAIVDTDRRIFAPTEPCEGQMKMEEQDAESHI